MKNRVPSWFNVFKSNYIDNYIKLVITSYQGISDESRCITKRKKIEEQNWLILCDEIRINLISVFLLCMSRET